MRVVTCASKLVDAQPDNMVNFDQIATLLRIAERGGLYPYRRASQKLRKPKTWDQNTPKSDQNSDHPKHCNLLDLERAGKLGSLS